MATDLVDGDDGDGWVWASFGLLLVLLGARAWVVETGHATLGRTPVKVKVLTGAAASPWRSWWGSSRRTVEPGWSTSCCTRRWRRRSKTPRRRPTPRRPRRRPPPRRLRPRRPRRLRPQRPRRLRSRHRRRCPRRRRRAAGRGALTRLLRAFRPTATYFVSRYSSMPTGRPRGPARTA